MGESRRVPRGEPLELRAESTEPALAASLPGLGVVGLDGALAERGRRMRGAALPGPGVAWGYRWRGRDQFTSRWWPQGIAVGEHEGTPLALVSWYAKPVRGVEPGSRVTIIDLTHRDRPTYRHVLLTSPRRTDAGVILDPVLAHAGGIAWSGDRLLVAATFDGIREFRLSDILRASSRQAAMSGYPLLLPEHAHYRAVDRRAAGRMRYSFLTVETPAPAPAAAPAAGSGSGLQLVAGEYHGEDDGRVARIELSDDRGFVTETHLPRVPRMQGAALFDGVWYLSASNGRRAGDLWFGQIGDLTVQRGVLPPGPEALAHWPDRSELWSASEIPGKRWVFRIDLAPDQRAPLR